MRHDLPKKIQLSAPREPWYRNEVFQTTVEVLVLSAFAAFTAVVLAGLAS